MLDTIQNFIKEMNSNNSLLHKKMILKKYQSNELIRKVLFYTYSSSINFYCTSKNVKRFRKSEELKMTSEGLFEVFDNLKDRKVTGNEALRLVCSYIKTNQLEEDIVFRIIDRNLKIRVNRTTLEGFFPEIFPPFYVSLANNYKESLINDEDKWFISRKLDGVRCMVFVDCEKETVQAFSRSGKRFDTLGLLEMEITKHLSKFSESVVLDGEIVMFDSNGRDNFKKIMEQITRKEFTMETPNYQIFDIIPLRDYYTGMYEQEFELRYKKLNCIFDSTFFYCHVVEQKPYSVSMFETMWNSIVTDHWEGLMLRKNCLWEGKRSNNLLKVKRMKDDEFRVVGIETGQIRFIDKGRENEKQTMSSIIVDYNNTKVGSGFTMEERDAYYKNPSLILDQNVTVQYFEKTKEKLRFPVYKGIRNEIM